VRFRIVDDVVDVFYIHENNWSLSQKNLTSSQRDGVVCRRPSESPICRSMKYIYLLTVILHQQRVATLHRNAHGASDRYSTICINIHAQRLQLEQNEENDETAEVTWGNFVFYSILKTDFLNVLL
jgi:hypothetical protein